MLEFFQWPIELIGRSDAEGEGGAQHIKESHRFFIKNSLSSFFKNISDAFTALAMDGTEFRFEVDRFRASDLREQSQYISQLVTSEVLSPEQARKAHIIFSFFFRFFFRRKKMRGPARARPQFILK